MKAVKGNISQIKKNTSYNIAVTTILIITPNTITNLLSPLFRLLAALIFHSASSLPPLPSLPSRPYLPVTQAVLYDDKRDGAGGWGGGGKVDWENPQTDFHTDVMYVL